ncbi:hypothetical protein [Actinomadura montaniterrae]|nr:hypothetical protein [Actinomadura montaniterrae]
MKVRLMGLPDEVDQATARLKQVFDVIDVSAHRPLRGQSRQVFVYLEIRL